MLFTGIRIVCGFGYFFLFGTLFDYLSDWNPKGWEECFFHLHANEKGASMKKG